MAHQHEQVIHKVPHFADEMLAAREVFITAATSICFSIVEIDGETIGNGHPGAMSERIRSAFFDIAEKTVI